VILTGSRLEIAEQCEASAVYAGIETITDASDLGSVKHAYLYDALTIDPKTALAAVRDEDQRKACARIDLPSLPAGQPGKWAGEVTFAIDLDSGKCRELGRNLMRRYLEAGLRPNEIPGTIDVLGLSADGEATIPADYKTGWSRVTRARDNLQLGFAAVASTEVYGRARADGAILYVREDAEPYFDVARLETFELVSMKERIVDVGRRIMRARKAFATHDPDTGEVNKKPRLVVGKHCRYCPVLMVCPANGALARRFMADARDTTEDLKKGLVDNAAAALLYRRLVALKAAVDNVLGIVHARAKNAPISLGNGLVLGEVVTMKDSLNPDVVAAVVREMYGEPWVSKATSLDTSKAALTRMARELKSEDGGSMKSHVERILEEVSRRGGVVSRPSRTIREHRALPAGQQGDDHG
jgi:hypothetical protein